MIGLWLFSKKCTENKQKRWFLCYEKENVFTKGKARMRFAQNAASPKKHACALRKKRLHPKRKKEIWKQFSLLIFIYFWSHLYQEQPWFEMGSCLKPNKQIRLCISMLVKSLIHIVPKKFESFNTLSFKQLSLHYLNLSHSVEFADLVNQVVEYHPLSHIVQAFLHNQHVIEDESEKVSEIKIVKRF